MDRIAYLKSFVRTVETGSFSVVARELQTTQPTISKQIAALEEYLQVQLLIRSTRSLSLTEEGVNFYQHCQRILEAIAEAEASVGKRHKIAGNLRVSCPVAFGQLQIVPLLKNFLTRFPDLKLDLIMTDKFVDLVEEAVDLAIRIGNLEDTSVITKRIGTTRRVTIGHQDYFQKAGIPQTPEDLVHHNCIVYTRLTTGNEWHFQGPQGAIKVRVKGNFQTNNSLAVREAVLGGLGIAVFPLWLLENPPDYGSLKVILPDYQPVSFPIQAIYRRSRFVPTKVDCLIDFLSQEFLLAPWMRD